MSLLDVDGRSLRLYALPDAVAIVAFVLVGELQHDYLAADAANPLRFVAVLAPFLVGWVLVAPPLGAYGPDVRSPRGLLGWTLLGWVGGDVVAQLLLATGLFPDAPDVQFFAVTAVFGGLFLLVARGVALGVSGSR